MSDPTETATVLLGDELQGFAIEFIYNTYAVRILREKPHDPDWVIIDDSQDPDWSELAV